MSPFCEKREFVFLDERPDWWSQTGSNRRPPACKAGALPIELQPRMILVGLDGFEPSTPALSRRCSNQLSYRPGVFTLVARSRATDRLWVLGRWLGMQVPELRV